MKKVLLTIGACMLFVTLGFGQVTLVNYSFTGDSGDPTSIETGLSSTALGLSSGTISFGSSSSSSWTGSGVPYVEESAGWTATSSGTGKYFTFTISTDGADSFDLSNISFLHRATSAGPSAMTVMVNGVEVSTIDVSANSTTSYSEALSVMGATSIEVRIIGWDNSSRSTSGGGAFRIDDIVLSGTVDLGSSPIITADQSSLGGMDYAEGGGPSSEKSFIVSGTNLTNDISIESTSNYEISTGTGGSFSATNPITLIQSGGTVSETTIYVRLISGLTEGSFNDDSLTITSTGADTSTVNLSGSVVAPFDIDYSNSFGGQDDYDLAITQGFTATTTDVRSGYLKIDADQYIESPTIDFTQYDKLEVVFELTTFGGSNEQEFSVIISDDNGTAFDDTLSTFTVPSSYSSFSTEVDLTGIYNVSQGKLRFEQTSGSASTRFRNFGIKMLRSVTISGDAGWRMLSLPVTDGDVEDISDDTAIQGVTGGSNSGFTSNIYYNDGSNQNGTISGWHVPTNTTTVWGDGLGFIIFFYDNTSQGSSELPVLLDASGTEPSSDVTVTLDSTYTLVGNPFASNIELDDITGNDSGQGVNDGLVSPISVWNDGVGTDETGSWETFNFGEGNEIATWQGFFLQRNGISTTSLTIPVSAKTDSTADIAVFSKAIASNWRRINLELETVGFKDISNKLYFSDISGVERDAFDGAKLNPFNNSPYISFVQDFGNGTEYLVQDARAFNPEGIQEYQLDFNDRGVSGGFTLSWPEWKNIPSEWSFVLKDRITGAEINMQLETEYTFSIQSKQKRPVTSVLAPPSLYAKSSGDEPRFNITLVPGTSVSNETGSQPAHFALEQNYPNPFNPNTTIKYSLEEAGLVSLTVYNIVGQKVAELVNEVKPSGVHTINWNASSVASGMYYYRLVSGNEVQTRKMTLIK